MREEQEYGGVSRTQNDGPSSRHKSATRERYSPAEDGALRTLAQWGLCTREIAIRIGRSYWSVHHRAKALKQTIERARRAPDERVGSYRDGYGVDWRAMTWDRLAWTYGDDRADRIQAGQDHITKRDVARWNALGRREAA